MGLSAFNTRNKKNEQLKFSKAKESYVDFSSFYNTRKYEKTRKNFDFFVDSNGKFVFFHETLV